MNSNIDVIKKGFVNCLFGNPSLLVHALSKVFGGAECTLVSVTENEITLNAVSSPYEKTPFNRTFVISYRKHATNNNFNVVTDMREI